MGLTSQSRRSKTGGNLSPEGNKWKREPFPPPNQTGQAPPKESSATAQVRQRVAGLWGNSLGKNAEIVVRGKEEKRERSGEKPSPRKPCTSKATPKKGPKCAGDSAQHETNNINRLRNNRGGITGQGISKGNGKKSGTTKTRPGSRNKT